MSAVTQPVSSIDSDSKPREPLHLKTWKEMREYFAAHLKPVGFMPKGQPIYINEDIKKLNVLLPDEK